MFWLNRRTVVSRAARLLHGFAFHSPCYTAVLMEWWPEELIWFDICAGRRCRRCEQGIAAAGAPVMRYCSVCAPQGIAPRPVHVCVDHRGGWCLTFASAEPDGFALWLVRVTDERLYRIINGASIAPSERADIPRALRAWGRTSFYAHMNEVQFHNLARAFREDPRNGYDKMRGLPAASEGTPRLKPGRG